MFVVATANDVTQLPPELLRKGRWDDLFFVDLPNLEERDAIWCIQIGRHGRDRGRYDTLALARASEGLTGAEIEQTVIDALYAGFRDRGITEPAGRGSPTWYLVPATWSSVWACAALSVRRGLHPQLHLKCNRVRFLRTLWRLASRQLPINKHRRRLWDSACDCAHVALLIPLEVPWPRQSMTPATVNWCDKMFEI